MWYLNNKIGFVLVITNIFFGCSSNSQFIKDGEALLRGPVKSLETNTYKPDLIAGGMKKGELVNGSGLTLMGGGGKRIFDENGKQIGFINYKKGSTNPAYYIENEYLNGNLTNSFTYKTLSKEMLVDKTEYEYDTKNREVVKRYFEPSYCEDNEMWLVQKIEYKYNEYDDRIRKIDSSFTHFDCDDIRIRARVIELHHQYENGIKTEDNFYLYEYDKDGNLIKKTDKKSPTIYYEYYPSGVRKKEFLGLENYDDFDKDGYHKKSVVALRKGDEYIFEYGEHDEYGNWTKMVIYEDGKPYLIGERKIIYYE